jgi:hypothetical protein
MNREQDKALQHLKTENRVLKNQLKKRGKRVRFTDKQQHLLATKAKELGRAALKNIDTVVTPETLLRWLRRFIAQKYDGSAKRGAGRPRINNVLAATDFFTVEVWQPVGLLRYHVLFVMHTATRRVHIAGIIDQPYGDWMEQIARNLTDCFDGFLVGKRYLLCDRDPLFTRGTCIDRSF